jgi:hypothetical protein
LSAYYHLLSGVSETILAFDPAAATKTVYSAGTDMDAARDTPFVGDVCWRRLLAKVFCRTKTHHRLLTSLPRSYMPCKASLM